MPLHTVSGKKHKKVKVSMSRKDYVKLAQAVKNLQLEGFTEKESYIVARELCKVLKSDNCNFKQTVFLKACGLPLQLDGG